MFQYQHHIPWVDRTSQICVNVREADVNVKQRHENRGMKEKEGEVVDQGKKYKKTSKLVN